MNRSALIQDYYDYLKKIHLLLRPKTYVEIGIRKGESFFLASTDTLSLGIDPEPQINQNVPENYKIYPMTSDEFFQTHDLNRELDYNRLDLAFIDGMHLFEYVLSDFINIEKYASASSIILIHDCLPLDAITSQRKRETNVWTGDVWKVIFCLLQYRPELKISILGAKPSGLALVSNLDPHNSTLENNKKDIIDTFTPLEFTFYEKNNNQLKPLLSDLEGAVRYHSSHT